MNVVEDIEQAVEQLSTYLREAKRVAAFTGAGASAASGVPTYRGAGGQWTRYDPAKYASIDYFRKDPSYYWSFFRDERYPALAKAEPNPVHTSLAELEEKGKLAALVTQNIDGLHQRGGSKRVLELHGNSRRFTCQSCHSEHDFEVVRKLIDKHIPPKCPDCKETGLRPAVVLFGESLPSDVLTEAFNEMGSADLVIVVGSSLVVQPAASLPLAGVQAGASLVILNIDPTPIDGLAGLVIRAPADAVLPQVLSSTAEALTETCSQD